MSKRNGIEKAIEAMQKDDAVFLEQIARIESERKGLKLAIDRLKAQQTAKPKRERKVKLADVSKQAVGQ